MAGKSYSVKQKEEIKIKLLETALNEYSKHGIKGVRLEVILKDVGISKPFFYKFFDSVPEFVIQVLDYQWIRLSKIEKEIEAHHEWTWQNKATALFDILIHHRDHGILIMTQEEEVWVRKHLDEQRYQQFMDTQISFFESLLVWWNIPKNKCDAKAFANMIISMIVVYNSGERSLPFLYVDRLEKTALFVANSIVAYLESLQNT